MSAEQAAQLIGEIVLLRYAIWAAVGAYVVVEIWWLFKDDT